MFSKGQIIHIVSKLGCLFPNTDIDGNIKKKKKNQISQARVRKPGKEN